MTVAEAANIVEFMDGLKRVVLKKSTITLLLLTNNYEKFYVLLFTGKNCYQS